MKNPGVGLGGFMIDDGCRCGRHVNIPENFDILLMIMLSQSILIRPLKSLIGVNNWRRCDTPVNVDVMSWMASICRTLVRAEFGKNTWSFATLWAVVKNDPLPCTRVWLKLMRLHTHVYLLRHSQPGDERLSNKEDFVDLSVIAEI